MLSQNDKMSEKDFPRFLCPVATSKGTIICTCGRCKWAFRITEGDVAAGQPAFDAHRCEDYPREEDE
jgi:hypothetical protein